MGGGRKVVGGAIGRVCRRQQISFAQVYRWEGIPGEDGFYNKGSIYLYRGDSDVGIGYVDEAPLFLVKSLCIEKRKGLPLEYLFKLSLNNQPVC